VQGPREVHIGVPHGSTMSFTASRATSASTTSPGGSRDAPRQQPRLLIAGSRRAARTSSGGPTKRRL